MVRVMTPFDEREVIARTRDDRVTRHTARPQREGAKMRQRPKTTLPPHNSITVTVTRSFMVEGASPYHEHPLCMRLCRLMCRRVPSSNLHHNMLLISARTSTRSARASHLEARRLGDGCPRSCCHCGADSRLRRFSCVGGNILGCGGRGSSISGV